MKKIVFLSRAADLRGGGEFSLIDVIREMKDEYKILCVCKSEGALSDALKNYGLEVIFCAPVSNCQLIVLFPVSLLAIISETVLLKDSYKVCKSSISTI